MAMADGGELLVLAPGVRMLERYDPAKISEGYNRVPGGDEVFFISNPGLGLWVHPDRFGSMRQEPHPWQLAQNR